MREFLKGLGLDQETIDSIMAEHGKLMTQNTEKITTLTNQVTTLKNENEELKKYDGKALHDTVEQLKQEKEDLIITHNQQLKDKDFDSALKINIVECGTIDPTALMAHVDKTKLKLNEDGTLDGWKEQLDSLKGSRSYLFNAKDTGGNHGGIGGNQNINTSLSGALTDYYK